MCLSLTRFTIEGELLGRDEWRSDHLDQVVFAAIQVDELSYCCVWCLGITVI